MKNKHMSTYEKSKHIRGPRYTVRPLGGTFWSQTNSLVQAKRDLREAQNRLPSKRVIIYDELAQKIVCPVANE